MENRDEFYTKLKGSLEETTTFPGPYLYKFIVPASGGQLDLIKAIFKDTKADINTKASRTGKYDSISISLTVKDADQVISFYKEVDQIEGVISL